MAYSVAQASLKLNETQCSPVCLWTHSSPRASAPQILGLQTGTSMTNFGCPPLGPGKASKTVVSAEGAPRDT